jgi:hypothetical protein
MQIVLEGGRWEGQHSFSDWSRDDQTLIKANVPEGSELDKKVRKTLLRTAGRPFLSAAQILDYSRMDVQECHWEDVSLTDLTTRSQSHGER